MKAEGTFLQESTGLPSTSMSIPLLFSVLFTLVLWISEPFYSALGLGWSLFLFLLFVNRLGTSLPVLELMLLMASLQWIVGAKISYANNFEHFRYFMYVDEISYMQIIVPGVMAFSLGVLGFSPKYSFERANLQLKSLVTDQPKIAYYLIFIGLSSTYLYSYVPAIIGFVLYLSASFQYVGLTLLLFQPKSKTKWRWLILIMGFLAVSSILKGMFHDLLLWSALLFSFAVIQLDLKLIGKLLLIGGGLLIAGMIQTIKEDFRTQLSGKSNTERLLLFSELVQDSFDDSQIGENENLMSIASTRLNQGWIISAIIDNIPSNEPFSNGSTITDAFKSSLLPRLLYPGKQTAGGRENFRRFTGLPIKDGTSMGTSIIGEAYGNYGAQGSWIFMFIWGAFLAWGFGRLVKYGGRHPIIFVFVPLIFLQVIKAETELYVVLNHFVKSLILVFAFLWLARRFLKWEV